MGTAQAYRLKQSMHVNRNLNPSLYDDSEVISAKSICQRWSTPTHIVRRLLNLRLTGLCRVYASCPINQSATFFLLEAFFNAFAPPKLPTLAGLKYMSFSSASTIAAFSFYPLQLFS